MQKAIGYIRVSTEEQAREGVSLEAQAERVTRYCQYAGLELVGVVEDAGISGGKNRGRAGFVELLKRVEAGGIGAVVVYSLDRLSRDLLTLFALERLLEENEIALHTVEGQLSTTTPNGFMNFAMQAFIGEVERRQIKHRTRGAMQHKKSRGEVVGSIPYGYRREGEGLVAVEAEQKAIKLACRLYKQGKRLVDIGRDFERRGIVTRGGGRWSPQQIKNLIPDYQQTWNKASKLNGVIREFVMAIA